MSNDNSAAATEAETRGAALAAASSMLHDFGPTVTLWALGQALADVGENLLAYSTTESGPGEGRALEARGEHLQTIARAWALSHAARAYMAPDRAEELGNNLAAGLPSLDVDGRAASLGEVAEAVRDMMLHRIRKMGLVLREGVDLGEASLAVAIAWRRG